MRSLYIEIKIKSTPTKYINLYSAKVPPMITTGKTQKRIGIERINCLNSLRIVMLSVDILFE